MGLDIHIKLGTAVDDALSGAEWAEVCERMGEPTTYRIRYQVDNSEQELTELLDPKIGPGSELAVVVPVDGQEQVLCQGPVRGQRMRLVHGGTHSWVEVIGADMSIELDREVKTRVWDKGSASDAVTQIASQAGFEPDVDDTADEYSEDKHTLVQRDTDLRFIRRLARRYGFLFWITSDPTGVHTAHFKRPPLDGQPAAALQLNIEPPTIGSIDLSWDVERPTSVAAFQLGLEDKKDIDGSVAASPLAPLGSQPLSAIASGTRSFRLVAPVDTAAELVQRAEGLLIEEGWFVRASCETSVKLLGKLVRAHTVVQLDGAGSRHGGKYFVAGVRHVINHETHLMGLDLVRNAWGA